MLQEWIHYVPIKNDFSDLNDKIQWCIENDDACRIISDNARNFVIEKNNWDYVKQYTIDLVKNKI